VAGEILWIHKILIKKNMGIGSQRIINPLHCSNVDHKIVRKRHNKIYFHFYGISGPLSINTYLVLLVREEFVQKVMFLFPMPFEIIFQQLITGSGTRAPTNQISGQFFNLIKLRTTRPLFMVIHMNYTHNVGFSKDLYDIGEEN
jgi:hypothetical protein